ncbi:conserved hypothetical protein [Delftia phage PhiW-14]|uniref:Nucleotidase n=1 Tax=Delftia phage PhiW-14 TaxID=665032 RepID=C9DFZ0_BPW14|nr:hypothetical protein DP-phiW-14_gp018 [Delftia phage PhiW-14]ACV50041.1 conserved hypothetical protein [Delftia phage PhiW-14]
MKRKQTIAIDVDLTVVDSLTPWIEWLNSEAHKAGIQERFQLKSGPCFDVGHEMIEWAKQHHLPISMYKYWQQPSLYDSMVPLDPMLPSLIHKWWMSDKDIVFVSHCFPEHTASKRRMLERLFGGTEHAFIAADSNVKCFVDYDVLIDDSNVSIKHGLSRRPESVHILMNQFNGHGYRGDIEEGHPKLFLADNWVEVEQLIN